MFAICAVAVGDKELPATDRPFQSGGQMPT
jgi:hypothetical protein